MEIPFSFSTKFEYPPVVEGRVIHQTILHLLVWGFLFYPAKKIMKPVMFTFLMFRSNTKVNNIIKKRLCHKVLRKWKPN